ncbi:MAG: Crp/Fnr family transcriptional regulator [Actinobacteria bacterium]|nr:Crp/Fnr family transcriptional regulator [Actinomycetota bacterium]
MTAATTASERTIRLLDYDPELGATLRPERREEARRSAQATLVEIGRGVRTARELSGNREAAYGVLLLDGLVNRAVVLDGVVSAQLLGRGDLVHVRDQRGEPLVETATRWIVLEPIAAALLDERFLLSVRRWPEVVAALFERLAAQDERREIHRALSQLPRVEDRIHALLWMLAERWGHVTPQGVTLHLRLTHELIGQLVGAKRPTVSLALKELEERGTVHRRPDGGWSLDQAWTTPPTGAPETAEGAGIVPDERPASARGAPLPTAPTSVRTAPGAGT